MEPYGPFFPFVEPPHFFFGTDGDGIENKKAFYFSCWVFFSLLFAGERS
jgi:hypothetical protein